MSLDLAAVGVEFKSTGEKVVAQSFSDLTTASDKLTATEARRVAANERTIAQMAKARTGTALAVEQERIWQAEMEAAARAFDAATGAQDRFARSTDKVRAELQAYAEEARRTEQATRGIASGSAAATTGLRTMSTTMATLAASELGARSGLGSFGSALGFMAVGSAWTVGIIAGITAIAVAFRLLTKESREAKERTDELMATLSKAAAARRATEDPGAVLRETARALAERIRANDAKIAAERAKSAFYDPATGATSAGPNAARILALQRENTQAVLAYVEATKQAGEQLAANAKTADKAADAAALAAKKAADAAEAHRKQVEEIAALERSNNTAFAKLTGDRWDAEQQLRVEEAAALEERLRGYDQLSTAEQALARIQLERELALTQATRQRVYEVQRALAVLKDYHAHIIETTFNLQARADAILNGFKPTVTGGSTKYTAESGMSPRTLSFIGQNIGRTVGGAYGNAFGGFVQGISTGDPYAVASSMLESAKSIVSGFFHSAASIAASAAALKKSQDAFAEAMGSFTDLTTGAVRAFTDRVKQVEKDAEALRKQAADLARIESGRSRGPGQVDQATLDAINAAERERIKLLEQERDALIQQGVEDLHVRALQAKGQAEDAALAEFDFNQARERKALHEQLGGDFLDTELAYVQQLEREKFVKDQATAASEAAAAAAQKEADAQKELARQLAASAAVDRTLRLRAMAAEAAIAGDATSAAAYEAAVRRADQEQELLDAVTAGWSEAQIATLAAVQANEDFARSMTDLRTTLAAAAAAAAAEARATEDLTVRHLRASGQGGAGDVAGQLFQQQEETRKAIEEGRSQEFLQTLARVQAEERAAADAARRQAQEDAFTSAMGQGIVPGAAINSPTSVNLAVGVSESTANRMVGVLTSQLTYQREMAEGIRALVRLAQRTTPLSLDAIDQGLATLGASGDLAAGLPTSNV